MPNKEWNKELFPAILKQAIYERGMTQRGLARIVGVSPNTIHSYLIGRNFPTLEVFVKIAIALNYSTDYLLGFTGPKALSGEDDALKEEILVMRSSYTAMTDTQKKAFLEFVKSITKE